MLAHMVEPMPALQEFRIWPQHITLVPWFDTDNPERLKQELEIVAGDILPLSLTIGEMAIFGARRGKPLTVRLIQKSPGIEELHEKLINITEKYGELVSERYIRERYTPHITRRDGVIFEVGQTHVLNSFDLIEAPRGSGGNKPKVSRARFEASHESTA